MIDSVVVLRIDWKGETGDSWTGLGGSCRMPSKLMGAWMLQGWKCGDKQGSQSKEGSPGRAKVVARRWGKASCISLSGMLACRQAVSTGAVSYCFSGT